MRASVHSVFRACTSDRLLSELECEALPMLAEMRLEAYPRIEDVKREHRRMLAEIKAVEMEYLVDAGEIVKVQGVSERDAVRGAIAALGPKAQFPIEVHTPATGEKKLFVLADQEKPIPPKKGPEREHNDGLRGIRKSRLRLSR